MSRDAEMAVRKCVDAIEFGLGLGHWSHTMSTVLRRREICATTPRSNSIPTTATGLILAISEVNVLISGAIVDAVDGTPYDETAAASLTNALIVAVTDIESYLD
jgi:hypothetical protein